MSKFLGKITNFFVWGLIEYLFLVIQQRQLGQRSRRSQTWSQLGSLWDLNQDAQVLHRAEAG